jgi:hypothetical protein
VACGAGELVEQQKPLEGGSWTVSALYLQGISLVRRNSEWHHFDPLSTAQVITNNSAGVVSNNLYDVFGLLRHQQCSAQTPWRWKDKESADEGVLPRKTIGYLTHSFGDDSDSRSSESRLAHRARMLAIHRSGTAVTRNGSRNSHSDLCA